MDDFHLVIRGADERTQVVSRQLARLQVLTDDDISLVCEAPFEEALRAAYETGIRAGKEWTVTLDADVLLRQDALPELLAHAQEMPSHYLELEGRIYDKVTGQYRQAGHRIYRTELLPLAIKQIPNVGSEIRPESFVVVQMSRLGHPFRHVGCVVGLHDFEQSYSDLYRKALVHSRKTTPILSALIERCAKSMQDDPDFLVILKGLWDGLTMNDYVTIDRRLFRDRTPEALNELGIEEKRDIEDVEQFVVSFSAMFKDVTDASSPPDVPVLDELKPIANDDGWMGKAQQRIAKYGLIKGSAASFGALLKHVGHVLDR